MKAREINKFIFLIFILLFVSGCVGVEIMKKNVAEKESVIEDIGNVNVYDNDNDNNTLGKEKLIKKLGSEEISPEEASKMTKDDWMQILTPEEYRILWKKGTERAFSGKYDKNFKKGVYVTKGCRIPVFTSDKKFDSGTGWPSFTDAIKENVILKEDNTLFTKRIEVLSKCGEHLGHVFDDGPKPSGKRFCINSLALDFVEEKE